MIKKMIAIDDDLFEVVTQKAKSIRLPLSAAIRRLLQKWVDGEVEI